MGPGDESWFSRASPNPPVQASSGSVAGISLNLPSQGALGLEKQELMGIKSAFPPPPAAAAVPEPCGSCRETLLGCVSHFGSGFRSDLGSAWEGPGRVGVGNAESATKNPAKAIPAGGLSMKCGGGVKEAKLPLDSWPREIFLAKKKMGLFSLEETPRVTRL